MKIAKSYKIITVLLLAFVLSLSVAFGAMNTPVVKADDEVQATNFVELTTGLTASISNDGAIVANVKENDSIRIKNRLVVSDLGLELSVPDGLMAKIIISADSYYVHGNKNANGGFDKVIKNEIEVVGSGAKQTVQISVVNNAFTASGATVKTTGDYYKVKQIAGMVAGSVEIVFEGTATDATKNFELYSIDQKVNGGNAEYKQSFKLNAEGQLENVARPRVLIADKFYTQTAKGQFVAKRLVSHGGNYETISTTVYSVNGKATAKDVYLSGVETDVALESGTDKPTKIAFKKAGSAINFNLVIDGAVCETISVNVLESDTKSAPVYKYDEQAVEGFKEALKEQYQKVDENNNVTSVPLGSTLKIPSMEDLVFDDVTPYDKLSVTTYFKARTESSTTKLEFDLDEVSNYLFFVAFADDSGNAMKKDDFMKEDSSTGEITYGKYGDANNEGNFIFSFVINDDADIIVKAGIKKGTGYRGVKYTATKFIIDAGGCTTQYKLFFNSSIGATEETNGWREIPKASSVKNETYVSPDGFNFNQIKAFAYDGNLTFVPTEVGTYMIECTATSDVSPRTATASTIVNVKEPTTVRVDTKWLQNNVWSVVFLSVGGLCLIGIIVVLCIKPKDEK